MLRNFLLLVLIVFSNNFTFGQDCIGGAITSNINYLHGRFEVRMQSAEGNGVVSSFFMYNVDLNCNWPAENNEIDVEMTGNSEDVLFTTHYPGPTSHNDVFDVPYNPHNEMHDYAFEWEPGIVRWFIDGQLVNVQDQPFVSNLIHPMRIMMNLWAANTPSWVGIWDPAIMPVSSQYEWVKYYAYTPGIGNYGTGNSYTFGWQDDFNSLDANRWTVTEEGGFDQNYCTFKSSSVEFSGGLMTLKLEEPAAVIETIPVTFRVNTASLGLLNTDNINLNGSFNNWCGICAPLVEDNDVWTKTINVPVGRHEYLFVKNNWEVSGGAPLGSSC
jgi:beta-glucanase (GH16 family)